MGGIVLGKVYEDGEIIVRLEMAEKTLEIVERHSSTNSLSRAA